jgi:hypothetical protein
MIVSFRFDTQLSGKGKISNKSSKLHQLYGLFILVDLFRLMIFAALALAELSALLSAPEAFAIFFLTT